MVTIDQINDFEKRLNSLYINLGIQDKEEFIKNEEIKTQKTDFWNDSKSAELIIKNIKQQDKWVKQYKTVKNSFEDLKTFYEFYLENEMSECDFNIAYNETKGLIEDIEFKNMLSAPEDNMSAILTINPGAGGTESQDWASMLMRMYIMWAGKQNFKIKELNFHTD